MQNAQLLHQHQCLSTCFHAPTMTTMDLTSENVTKPQLNAFFYKSCPGHSVSLHNRTVTKPVWYAACRKPPEASSLLPSACGIKLRPPGFFLKCFYLWDISSAPDSPYGTFSLFLWVLGTESSFMSYCKYWGHSGCQACTVIAFTQWVVKKPSAFCLRVGGLVQDLQTFSLQTFL